MASRSVGFFMDMHKVLHGNAQFGPDTIETATFSDVDAQIEDGMGTGVDWEAAYGCVLVGRNALARSDDARAARGEAR